MNPGSLRLLGFPPSTFSQTAALVLTEKGVDYQLELPTIRDPAYVNYHPWCRVPVLLDGKMRIFESLAIAMYVDEKFVGPPLQPSDLLNRFEMFKWISIFLDYGTNSILQFSVRERFLKKLRGQTPDQRVIDQNRPAMSYFCAQMDRSFSSQYIAGNSISIADLFLIPPMLYFEATPEGKEILSNKANVIEWLSRVKQRNSVRTICTQLSLQTDS